MGVRASEWFAVLAAAYALAACQGMSSDQPPTAATAAAISGEGDHPEGAESAPTPIAWAGAGDCLGQRRLLQAAAAQGRLEQSHEPPFAVVLSAPTTSLEWVRAPAVPIVTDLPLESYEDQRAAATAAPCLLQVEPARDLRAQHRVIDFEEVASAYQSGIRSEKNPDYDVAQARLRDAERQTKARWPSVLKVGDPMLDLVGLLVGGVIAAFGEAGGEDDVVEALARLKATPRSRDRPVYRAYTFERSTVRVGKEAVIPLALSDLRRGRVWRTNLRQREMRRFSVLEGLDPRDRDYEQHRAGALSWQEFEHWQRQPPQLPLSALVAALVETGGTGRPQPSGPGLLADAAPAGLGPASTAAERAALTPQSAAVEPAAGSPQIDRELSSGPSAPDRARPPGASRSAGAGGGRQTGARSGHTVLAALDPRVASVVRLEAAGRSGSGLYIKPRLVVTTGDLVGTASTVDVTTSDGERVLGLVMRVDPARNLALVHVPRSGQPATLAVPPAGPGRTIEAFELVGDDRARIVRAVLRPAFQVGGPIENAAPTLHLELEQAGAPRTLGAPLFLEERAIGLVADQDRGLQRNVILLDPDELLAAEAFTTLQ